MKQKHKRRVSEPEPNKVTLRLEIESAVAAYGGPVTKCATGARSKKIRKPPKKTSARRRPSSNGPAKAALRREIEALSQGVTITRCEAHKRTPKPRRAPTAQITEGKEAA